MKTLRTWVTTAVLLAAWVGMANAGSIWTEEIYTWIIRFFILHAGGDWS